MVLADHEVIEVIAGNQGESEDGAEALDAERGGPVTPLPGFDETLDIIGVETLHHETLRVTVIRIKKSAEDSVGGHF